MSITDTRYIPVDAVRTGSAGEITLNVHLEENADYLIAKGANGTVVAVPKADVPEREWDLWDDPELRKALWRGFDDAFSNRVQNLDDVLAELGLDAD